MDGGLAERLGFDEAVEVWLERGEAAGEAGFLAVEVGEGVRLHEALKGEDFEGEFVETGEQVCDGRVCAHAVEFKGDEFGFVRGDAAETPVEVRILGDDGGFGGGLGRVALLGGGAEGEELLLVLRRQERGAGGEAVRE